LPSGSAGVEERKTRIELADALAAAGTLIEFHQNQRGGHDLDVKVLNLPPELAAALSVAAERRREGNGHDDASARPRALPSSPTRPERALGAVEGLDK
jgi:hypothetical protein